MGIGLFVTGLFLALAIGYFLGVYAANVDTATRQGEPYEAAVSWRKINLAVGEGFVHPDADQALANLRRAGWYIEKAGSERAGWVYLKIIAPNHKEQ